MEEALRRVYEREHRVAETLQRSLLPEKLPDIEGVTLAARYLPAGAGAAVGGDWYDAAELPDGRVALVVGDVVGHGLRAAAVMGQLRNAFRAYSITDTSPAEIVARLNRLVTTGDEGVMATVLYLALDRDTGEVSYASAGHPPPLLLTPDGPRYLEGGPLGAGRRRRPRDLPRGAHARCRPTRRCCCTRTAWSSAATPRSTIASTSCAAAAGAAGAPRTSRTCATRSWPWCSEGAEPADDVALLAVRPDPIDADHLDLTLPAEPEVLARLRRRLARFLHAAGASEEETYEITLTISEAAGNAIEHAYGPGDATLPGPGGGRGRRGRGGGPRLRPLARAARRAPRPRAEHHRGPHGAGGGGARGARHHRPDAPPAEREGARVTHRPRRSPSSATGAMIVARLTGEVDMTNATYIGEELTKAVPNEALGAGDRPDAARATSTRPPSSCSSSWRASSAAAASSSGSPCPRARRCAGSCC